MAVPAEEKIFIQEFPKRPSPFRKFLIRAIIAVLIAFLLAVFYWYFEIKRLERIGG